MSINLLTGLPGSGKTTALVAIALQALDEKQNVYTHFHIDTPSAKLHQWRGLDELANLVDGLIILDEAQVWFNSRKWKDLPDVLQYKLQQHRKQGLHIWATCQNIARLDTVMRELVSNFYVCRRVFVIPFFRPRNKKSVRYALYNIREYEPEEAQKKERRKLQSRWYIGLVREDELPSRLPASITSAYGRYDTLRTVER